MKDKIRILSVSRPGGDLGPAVGYANHLDALNHPDFEVTELTQEIWNDLDRFREFDIAWAYVRFPSQILDRCRHEGIPFIGGPNIAMERADVGISDVWEKWYLEESHATMNLNVADYYTAHVRKFAKGIDRCETLEYCYSLGGSPIDLTEERPNDVLVYVKDRVNDGASYSMSTHFCELLAKNGFTYKMLNYGSYNRSTYLDICSQSKVTAWFSIEDYCSLAQIESQLLGSCVIGSEFNLTIPVSDSAICKNSQYMDDWVRWKDEKQVVDDYFTSMRRMLAKPDLAALTIENSTKRHSNETYRARVKELLL